MSSSERPLECLVRQSGMSHASRPTLSLEGYRQRPTIHTALGDSSSPAGPPNSRRQQQSGASEATPDKAWESDIEARSPTARWFVKHRNEAGVFVQRAGDADAPVRLERLTKEPRRDGATRGGDSITEGDLRNHLAKLSGRLAGAKSEEELRAAVASVMEAGIGWMEGVQTALTTAEETLKKIQRVRLELREASHFGGIHEMGEALTATGSLWEPALDDRAFNELVQSVREKLGRLTEERREMAQQYMFEAKRLSSTMAAISAWFLLKDALARLRQTGASPELLMEAESAIKVVSDGLLKISPKQVRAAAAELMKDDATQRAVLQCDQWLDTNHATLRERSIVKLHVAQLRSKAIRRLRSAIESHLWGYAEVDCAIAHAVQDARDVGKRPGSRSSSNGGSGQKRYLSSIHAAVNQPSSASYGGIVLLTNPHRYLAMIRSIAA
ncbi:hypothetical protein FOZ63_014452 [Perkinsus olseni]|uniref:Uncharacterized protein n=1 Tax=Perkinsus olseni TaxID=32597 RepID=A0A7J6RX23_PEROL|nr:hypothetical protein FOZ63_014452 [Perkinsus olseni]